MGLAQRPRVGAGVSEMEAPRFLFALEAAMSEPNATERFICLIETIEELSPRQREVLEYRLAGYTQAETAEKLGITQQAVAYYLRQARNKIRQAL